MSRKHVIKYYTRLFQKGMYTKDDIPEDMRDEVIELSKTLPLREDMKNNETNENE